MSVAAVEALTRDVLPEGPGPAQDARRRRPKAFKDIVKIGRTHLQDATPLTLGQEFSRLRGPARPRPQARRGRAPAPRRAGARRHRGGHRPQCPSRVRRAGREEARGAHRPALRDRAQQVRGAGRERRARARPRRAQDARGLAHEDRQRRPLARLRPALRHRRTHHPGERAGLVDHARQGEPHAVRGDDHAVRAGDRQRRRGQYRRRVGQLRAQRLQAADHPQLPAERAAHRRRLRELPRPTAPYGIEPNAREDRREPRTIR